MTSRRHDDVGRRLIRTGRRFARVRATGVGRSHNIIIIIIIFRLDRPIDQWACPDRGTRRAIVTQFDADGGGGGGDDDTRPFFEHFYDAHVRLRRARPRRIVSAVDNINNTFPSANLPVTRRIFSRSADT